METLMKSKDEFKTEQEYNEYLRKYFAGLAMQGLMMQAIPGSHNHNDEHNNVYRAKFAVDMADELLKQLDK